MQINLSQQSLKARTPITTPYGSFAKHDMIVISMMDEKGQRIGLGECSPLSDHSCDSDAYIRMSEVASLINKALASEDYVEVLRPYPALLFALESAMYDYQHNSLLYDTSFARSEVGIPVSIEIADGDYDTMLNKVKQCLLHGFRSVTLCASPKSFDEVLKLLSKIRSRFSSRVLEVRMNFNGSFLPTATFEYLNQLVKYDIHSVSQPIKRYQWNDMAELCSSSPVPIALDEELTGVNTFEEKRLLLETIKPHYIKVHPMLHGGMAGCIEWISEAQKRGIGSWLASTYEGNIGLRNIALLAARIYGKTMVAQSLCAESLYSDNIEMDIEIRGGKLWRCEVAE